MSANDLYQVNKYSYVKLFNSNTDPIYFVAIILITAAFPL
jgi:hypothetical protein